jgi:hypothetical protein
MTEAMNATSMKRPRAAMRPVMSASQGDGWAAKRYAGRAGSVKRILSLNSVGWRLKISVDRVTPLA